MLHEQDNSALVSAELASRLKRALVLLESAAHPRAMAAPGF